MTALSTLIDRTRRYVRDWPDMDSSTASISSNGTTLTVADTTLYTKNWALELDQEVMLVRALASGTQLTVKRGAFGSTAASHASGSSVLMKPEFFAVEYIDALNAALDSCFPYLYKPVLDTSLTVSENVYEYTVPNMPSTSIPIPFLSKVEVKETGDFAYRETQRWMVRRGATPKIQFREVPLSGATVRVQGYGPFAHLSSISDTLDALFPAQAESLLPTYAAGWLLQSGEAGRVRFDVGALDQREQANRVGSAIQAGAALINRFRIELTLTAMPPMPGHIVSVF